MYDYEIFTFFAISLHSNAFKKDALYHLDKQGIEFPTSVYSWIMDPLGPNMGKRRGPRGGSLKSTSSNGFGTARAGPLANFHRRLGPSASISFNSPVRIAIFLTFSGIFRHLLRVLICDLS